MNRYVTGILSGVSGLLLCATVWGQEPPAPPPAGPPPPPRPGPASAGEEAVDQDTRVLMSALHSKKIAEKLALTQEQQDKMRTALQEFSKLAMELKQKLEKQATSQVEVLSAEKIDEKALMDAVEETGKTRTELAKLRMKQFVAFHKMLSDEQRAKLKDLREEFKEKMKARMHERKGREGGEGGSQTNVHHGEAAQPAPAGDKAPGESGPPNNAD